MNTSPVISELTTALAAAQGEMDNPRRNKTVTVRTKAGGTYQFSYADFAACLSSIRAPLAKNGLCFTQTVEQLDGKFRLETVLWHASGQFISSVYPLMVEEAGSQSFGSALTYMKRYALCAMLGLAADDDDDANAGEGNTATATEIIRPGRKPKAPGPNVLTASPAVAPPADERAPSDSRSGVADGARGLAESDTMKAHDAKLAKAAATGDMVALEAAWKDIPLADRPSLRGALERRHKPQCQIIAATKKEQHDGSDSDERRVRESVADSDLEA